MASFRTSFHSKNASCIAGSSSSATRRSKEVLLAMDRFRPRALVRALAGCSMLSMAVAGVQAQVLPSGATIVNGQVRIATTGNKMTVTNSNGAIIDWKTFSIGAGQAVRFEQANSTSQVLNRVVGNDPSNILGSLSSNGRVWLLNPNGVLFGQGARINVAGLVASTLSLNNSDWLAGKYRLTPSTPGALGADVVNQGEIRTPLGGRVALVGGNVRNEGVIDAPGGQVMLAAGQTVDLVDTGAPNVLLRVTAPSGEAMNLGTISADGGSIDVQAAIVNQSGIIRADSYGVDASGRPVLRVGVGSIGAGAGTSASAGAVGADSTAWGTSSGTASSTGAPTGGRGSITLRASEALNLNAGSVTSAVGTSGASGGAITLDSGTGTTWVHGKVDVTSDGAAGGQVKVLGRQVGLGAGSLIDASGATGGGQILVGGGQEGKDPTVPNSEAVYMDAAACLAADATQNGNGGRVILWADRSTRAYGSMSARGGPLGGNGGFIETSGGWLDAQPLKIDASAPKGVAGTWLLDPYDIVIRDAIDTLSISTDGAGSFVPNGGGAQIRSSDIVTALNNGNSVVIGTGTLGSEMGDVTFDNANIIVNPTAPVGLQVYAARNIEVNGSRIESTNQALNINLFSGQGGKGGVWIGGSTIITAGGTFAADGPGDGFASFDPSVDRGGVRIHGGTSIETGVGGIAIQGRSSSEAIEGRVGVSLEFSNLGGRSIAVDGLADTDPLNPRATGIQARQSTIAATHTLTLRGTASGSGIDINGGQLSVGPPVPDSGLFQLFGTSNGTGPEASRAGLSMRGTRLIAGGNRVSTLISGAKQVSPAGNTALSLIEGTNMFAPSGGATFVGRGGAIFQGSFQIGGQINIFADSVDLLPGTRFQSLANLDSIVVANNTLPFTFRFTNQAGAGAFVTPANGRWLIYAGVRGSVDLGGLPFSFTQYDARLAFGPDSRRPTTGNGLIFNERPIVAINGGGYTKSYDSTNAAGSLSLYSPVISGEQNGDTINLIGTGTVFSNKNAGLNKPVSIGAGGLVVTDTEGRPVIGYGVDSRLQGDITPATLTLAGVSANNKVYDATTVATLSTGSASLNGVFAGDAVGLSSTSLTATFNDKNVGDAKPVTVTGASLNGTDAGNYRVGGFTSLSANITPAPLSVVGLRANNKTYDASTAAALNIGTADLAGRFSGDEVVLNSAELSASFNTADVGTAKPVSLNGVSIAGADARNYRLSGSTGLTADITPAALTITANNAAKTFGEQLTFAGTEFTTSGLVAQQTVGSVVLQSAGSSPDATVANGPYPIFATNAGGGTFTPTNYTITYVPGSLTVVERELRLVTGNVVGVPTKVYDGTATATLTPANYNLTGFAAGQSASVSKTTGTYDSSNAGNRTITVTLAGTDFVAAPGTDLSNYRLPTVVTGPGLIEARLLTLVGLRAESRAYDGTVLANLTDSGTLSGLVGGQRLAVSNTSATFDTKNVGVGKTVTLNGVTLSNLPGDNGDGAPLLSNYRIAPIATTTADITRKDLIARNLTAASRDYNGTTVASVGVVSYDGLVFNETLGTSGLTGTFDTKDVGTQKLVTISSTGLVDGANGGLASNYRISPDSPTTTRADIRPAPLTITANSTTKRFDTQLTFNGTEFTPSGLVPNETVSSVTLESPGAARSATVVGGPYVITAKNPIGGSGFDPRNYAISFVDGTLTVTRADLDLRVTIDGNPTKVYDGSNSAALTSANFTLTGFAGSDNARVGPVNGRYDSANAGSRTVTATLGTGDFLPLGSTDLGNYNLPATATGTGTILQKPVTVIGTTANNKVYDGDARASLNNTAATFDGLVDNQTLRLNAGSATFDNKNVGNGKTVTVNDLTLTDGSGLASNYRLTATTTTTTANINPQDLTFASVTASDKVYNGDRVANVTLGGLVGLVKDETLTTTATGQFDTKDAGTAKTVTVSTSLTDGSNGGLASNYRLAPTTTTTANINQKDLTLASITASNKVYDGDRVASLTLGAPVGLVKDETLTIKATGQFDTKDAGTGKTVTVSTSLTDGSNGGLAGNYRIAPTTTTTADITQKDLALSGVAASNKVYDGDRAASITTGSLVGLVGSESLNTTATGQFDTKDAGTGKTVTVTTSLTNGSGLASNYKLAPSVTTTADIDRKDLSLASVTAANKVYDGDRGARVTLGGLVGLVKDETLTTTASGQFDTKDAGTGKTVTVSTSLTNGTNGGLAGNYRIAPSATTTANITTAQLSGTIVGNPSKTFDGTDTAALVPSNFNLTGFVTGESATVNQGTGRFDSVESGPRTVTASLNASVVAGNGGTDIRNYTLPSLVSGLGTITALPPAIQYQTNVPLSAALNQVTIKQTATSATEGRALDAVPAMNSSEGSGGGGGFKPLSISGMSMDALASLLASRDQLKKNLFRTSLNKLAQDPKLADLGDCLSVQDLEAGNCIITDSLKASMAETRRIEARGRDAAAEIAAQAAQAAAVAPRTATIRPPTTATTASAGRRAQVNRKVVKAALPQIARKIAVLIGIDNYTDKTIPSLDNAARDAQAVGKVLENQLGYEVTVLRNSSKEQIFAALNRLAGEVDSNDSVVIYYAGHGAVVESTGLGYWQPANAVADKPDTWISNSDINKLISRLGAQQVALISDSCFSGSLITGQRIRASANLLDPSKVLAQKSVVLMASGGNEPVFDSGKDGHSPFAWSLMRNLEKLPTWQAGGNVFERVRFAVAREMPQKPQYAAVTEAGHQAGGDYLFEQRELEGNLPER